MAKSILMESTKSNFKVLEHKPANVLKRIQGVLSDFKSNRNGRIYPRELWENVLNSDYVKEMIESHGLVGELDHPEERLEISLQNVSHVINDMWIEGDKVMGTIDILPTPSGKIVSELLDYGTDIGISSRGAGSVGAGNIVDPDYQFVTFDFVARPSCEAARLNMIVESVKPEIDSNSDDKVKSILEGYKSGLKEDSFKDMVSELHSYVEADPTKISKDLKDAIKNNKLTDYLKSKAAMTDDEISEFKNKYSLKESKTVDFEYIGRDDWGRHIIKSKDTGTYFGDTNLTKAGKERDLSNASWYTYSGNDPYEGEPEASMQDDIIVNIVNPEKIPTDYQRNEYELLYRLKSDCDYFLGNGNGYEGHLWAKSVDKQIAKMRELYDQLEEKPEWLTSEDIDRYERKMLNYNKEGLNESVGKPNYVDAYINLIYTLNDGLGDLSALIEWAESLADDYNIKYNEDDFDLSQTEPIFRKAFNIQFKKDPGAFKEGVESLIQYNCLENGDFEYLYSKIHREPEILEDLKVILDYLNKNSGDPKLIEGLQAAINNIDTIAVNARQIAEELCKYINDNGIWKYLGTSVRFWASNEIEHTPKGYTCIVGEYFNLLLFKKSSELEGIALLFKDNKEEVIAELYTYGYNKESEEKYRVITMDNFKPLGDSFTITNENKEQVFKQIDKKFKDTINKLKVQYMETEKEFCSYWNETKERYEKEKKKYLTGIKLKESSLKESQSQDIEALINDLKKKNPNIEEYLNAYFKTINAEEPKPVFIKNSNKMNPEWENWSKETANIFYNEIAWNKFVNWVKENYKVTIKESVNEKPKISAYSIAQFEAERLHGQAKELENGLDSNAEHAAVFFNFNDYAYRLDITLRGLGSDSKAYKLSENFLVEAKMTDQEVYKAVLGWYKEQIEKGNMTLNQCYELLSDKAKVSLNKMVDQSKIKESMINSTIKKLINESIELNKKD